MIYTLVIDSATPFTTHPTSLFRLLRRMFAPKPEQLRQANH
jgi:hypothetical protein